VRVELSSGGFGSIVDGKEELFLGLIELFGGGVVGRRIDLIVNATLFCTLQPEFLMSWNS
jgi:hypothetical protein